VAARAAHGRAYKVTAREAVAVGFDTRQQLVAEDQVLLAVGRNAEPPVGDLPVGAAHSHAQGTQEDFVGTGRGVRDLGHPGRVRMTGRGDESEHPLTPP